MTVLVRAAQHLLKLGKALLFIQIKRNPPHFREKNQSKSDFLYVFFDGRVRRRLSGRMWLPKTPSDFKINEILSIPKTPSKSDLTYLEACKNVTGLCVIG